MLQNYLPTHVNWHNRPYSHGFSAKSNRPWKILDSFPGLAGAMRKAGQGSS